MRERLRMAAQACEPLDTPSAEEMLLLRMFSCPIGQNEQPEELQLPMLYSLPMPPTQERPATWSLQRQGFDSSSTPSVASSQWQFQVWPKPVFKMQTDAFEDDATSPLCTEPPGD
jgi:hypothetical protein